MEEEEKKKERTTQSWDKMEEIEISEEEETFIPNQVVQKFFIFFLSREVSLYNFFEVPLFRDLWIWQCKLLFSDERILIPLNNLYVES